MARTYMSCIVLSNHSNHMLNSDGDSCFDVKCQIALLARTLMEYTIENNVSLVDTLYDCETVCVIMNSVFNCVHSNHWLLLVVMV